MIKKLQKMRAEKGFTLAELLVVILIIAILATLAIVFFTGQQQTAQDGVDSSNIRSAYSVVQADRFGNGGDFESPADMAAAITASGIPSAVGSSASSGDVNVDNTSTATTVILHSGNCEGTNTGGAGALDITCTP